MPDAQLNAHLLTTESPSHHGAEEALVVLSTPDLDGRMVDVMDALGIDRHEVAPTADTAAVLTGDHLTLAGHDLTGAHVVLIETHTPPAWAALARDRGRIVVAVALDPVDPDDDTLRPIDLHPRALAGRLPTGLMLVADQGV